MQFHHLDFKSLTVILANSHLIDTFGSIAPSTITVPLYEAMILSNLFGS
jgi:hypothetical protein